MSQEQGSSPRPHVSPEVRVYEVLARFDAYARARGGQDSIFSASRTTPQQEARAFDDLAQAVARLRNAFPDAG
ncbi:hypothetical protein [Streptomyces similanensis]|uniref:Uncharacterized protein n=1 Tax=Streptomyces similanensis TaxID=1274988 RepID=A0ABP9LTI7_9ACTN